MKTKKMDCQWEDYRQDRQDRVKKSFSENYPFEENQQARNFYIPIIYQPGAHLLQNQSRGVQN